jgi:hypothetical protein
MIVMAGLDPAIHGRRVRADMRSFRAIALSWMLGSSPSMTTEYEEAAEFPPPPVVVQNLPAR